jgi:hypothetical protein
MVPVQRAIDARYVQAPGPRQEAQPTGDRHVLPNSGTASVGARQRTRGADGRGKGIRRQGPGNRGRREGQRVGQVQGLEMDVGIGP